jgi:anti-sigma factor RsiW
MNCREVEPLLGAYLDGELDLLHSLDIDAHLGDCARCSRAIEELKQLELAVSAMPRYRASKQLRGRLARSAAAGYPAAHQAANARWLALAAGLLLGAVAVWKFAPVADHASGRMESEIVENHIRSLLADHLVDVHSGDRQTIQPWFSGKLDYAPEVEDISAHGFRLLGGRLDYLDGRAVAALVYQRAQHIINVFVWPARGQPDRGPRAHSVEGYQAVSWRAKGMNWWAVSDLNAAGLEELPLCPCFMPPHPPLEASNLRNAVIRPASDRRGP